MDVFHSIGNMSSWSVTFDAGLPFPLGSSWFLDPQKSNQTEVMTSTHCCLPSAPTGRSSIPSGRFNILLFYIDDKMIFHLPGWHYKWELMERWYPSGVPWLSQYL
jgi:hypothetical protein